MATNKPSGRFVPTLTEIVRPGMPTATATATAADDNEQLVQQVLQLVKPRIEQQLRVSLQALIEQHMRLSAPSLQRGIEDAVRVAVAQNLDRQSAENV